MAPFGVMSTSEIALYSAQVSLNTARKQPFEKVHIQDFLEGAASNSKHGGDLTADSFLRSLPSFSQTRKPLNWIRELSCSSFKRTEHCEYQRRRYLSRKALFKWYLRKFSSPSAETSLKSLSTYLTILALMPLFVTRRNQLWTLISMQPLLIVWINMISRRTTVAMCLVNSDDFAKFHLTFPRILNRTLHMQSCSTRFLSIISLFSSFRTTSYNAFQWYQM